MSELTNTQNNPDGFRQRLMITVSAVALLASVCTVQQANATEGDSVPPPFWIELGGQLARQENDQAAFLPPFLLTTPRPSFDAPSPAELERVAASSWDETAKISFEPAGTDLVFSAGILYGKSSRNKFRNQITAHPTVTHSRLYIAYQDFAARSSESHTILDFQASKDVGLGIFGSGGSSIVSFGVRYVQFNANNNVSIQSQPTNFATLSALPFHRFYANLATARKFTGVGPSLSWDASADLIGNSSAGAVSFDWGLNGAVLFGRQQMRGHHQTTDIYHYAIGNYARQSLVYQHPALPNRSKETVVPNLGGFAGLSWRLPSAKVSIGYRADMFFGAMDGGIDAAHRENIGFYGPFATVSVGIGG
jgi:hypothetical protein